MLSKAPEMLWEEAKFGVNRERCWPQTPLAFTHKATVGPMRVALVLVSLHPANVT